MSFRVAAALGAVATSIVLAAGFVFAHEGANHGEQPAVVGTSPGIRAESTSGGVELVAVAKNGALEIYLDDFATNAPLENASVEVETKPKKGNGGSAPETDEQRKTRCVEKLQALFAKGYKDQVRGLLKQYGDGAKNFHGVPVEKFAEIDKAIEELKL